MKKIIEYIKAAKNWVGTDGLLHFCVSALFMVTLGWVKPLYCAIAAVVVIGILKEVYDMDKNGVLVWKDSLHDLACDFMGIGFGLLVVWLNSLG